MLYIHPVKAVEHKDFAKFWKDNQAIFFLLPKIVPIYRKQEIFFGSLHEF